MHVYLFCRRPAIELKSPGGDDNRTSGIFNILKRTIVKVIRTASWPTSIYSSSSGFLAYLWGIETSYKPQRQLLYCRFLAYLWGIETTIRGHPGWVCYSVFSVPMRNWNFPPEVSEGEREIVFSVPMRNWNIVGARLKISMRLVFSLPMRNWNKWNGSNRRK